MTDHRPAEELGARKGAFLEMALKVMVEAHIGQLDRGGAPYCLHPITVMNYLNTTDEQLQCVALLHDVAEDSGFSLPVLKRLGFTRRILDAVDALTKKPGQDYAEYRRAVLSNKDAMQVKLCDLRHNMDLSRLQSASRRDIERKERYLEFYREIEAKFQETCND